MNTIVSRRNAGIQAWLVDRAGLRVHPNWRVHWHPAMLPVTILQSLTTMALMALCPEA